MVKTNEMRTPRSGGGVILEDFLWGWWGGVGGGGGGGGGKSGKTNPKNWGKGARGG
jgi:hypothetical protein